MSLRVYLTAKGALVEESGAFKKLPATFQLDQLFTSELPLAWLRSLLPQSTPTEPLGPDTPLFAPLVSQEIWAAGVTYLRSRTARMEESKTSGGDTFYDKVYQAERPEIFFKATPHRVAAPGTSVRIRGDSKWNVPEPELTLALNHQGKIFGYTIGNDMSSRDIEGENPLYLPQAKVYDRSAAIGPCLLVTDQELSKQTEISIEIRRGGSAVFTGATTISQIKRGFGELAEFLYRDNSFPKGSYLMTGTGVVPGDSFTLKAADEIRITIPPVGTLVNHVA